MNDLNMDIILITGTPGVGKTTLASHLEQQNYDVINIMELAKAMDATGEVDEERNAIIIDDDKIHDNFHKWLQTQETDLIVIEGHIADLIPRDILTHCFVLSPSIEVLRPRLESRGYSESKIMENIEAHIMKECLYDALEYYGEEKVTVISEEDKTRINNQVISYLQDLP